MEESDYKLGKRTVIKRNSNQLFIGIKMKADFFIVVFSILSFSFASLITFFVAIKAELSFFICVWLFAFASAILFLAYIFIWNLFGSEIIRIYSDKLIFERRLLNFKIIKSVFDTNKIRNIRIPTASEIIPSPAHSYDWFKISGGNIAFDYDEDIYTFGIDLTKSEASEIIAVIQKDVS
jgi:hypothetical protein